MKVLFLDVDGVLNIMSESYHSHSYLHGGTDPLEYHLISRLEYIIDRIPDLKIVVSSSWGLEKLTEKLKQCNFKYIDNITDSVSRYEINRGNQIKDWLNVNSVKSYAVLDDEIFDICGDKCNTIPSKNVVEVNMNEGLSNKNCTEVISIINNLDLYPKGKILLTSDRFDLYRSLGYRPQVTGSKDELLSRWKYIVLSTDNLYMMMSN